MIYSESYVSRRVKARLMLTLLGVEPKIISDLVLEYKTTVEMEDMIDEALYVG